MSCRLGSLERSYTKSCSFMKKVSFYIKSVNHTKQLQLLLFIFTHTGPLKIFMKTRKDKWTT